LQYGRVVFSLLMKVKVESETVGLKLNIQKTKIMASGPTTSWEIDGETVETVSDFIFLDSKITADGDCSHEIKRRLLLGRKVMTLKDKLPRLVIAQYEEWRNNSRKNEETEPKRKQWPVVDVTDNGSKV